MRVLIRRLITAACIVLVAIGLVGGSQAASSSPRSAIDVTSLKVLRPADDAVKGENRLSADARTAWGDDIRIERVVSSAEFLRRLGEAQCLSLRLAAAQQGPVSPTEIGVEVLRAGLPEYSDVILAVSDTLNAIGSFVQNTYHGQFWAALGVVANYFCQYFA